jgi:hypothetical protein
MDNKEKETECLGFDGGGNTDPKKTSKGEEKHDQRKAGSKGIASMRSPESPEK